MFSQPTASVQVGTGEAGCGLRGTKSCSLGICCLQGVAGEGSWGTHRGEPEGQTCLGLPPAQLCPVFLPGELLRGLRLDTVAGGSSAKLGFLCSDSTYAGRSALLSRFSFPRSQCPRPSSPPHTHQSLLKKPRAHLHHHQQGCDEGL